MHFVLIANPVSGRGRSLAAAAQIRQKLQDGQHQVREFHTTPDPSDLEAFCQSITADERVVVLGGDGTLNAFLEKARDYACVAFYGTGTANVVRIEWGLPTDISRFVAMLLNGRIVESSLGELDGDRRFLMMYSAGIDGFVLTQVGQSSKNRLGKWAFVFAAVKSLFKYSYPCIRFGLDNGETLSGYWVFAARFRNYGGGFCLVPWAGYGDPDLHVLVFQGRGLWKTLGFIWSLMRGRVAQRKDVQVRRAQSLKVEHGPDVFAQVDGELLRAPVSQIRISARRHRFLLPDAQPDAYEKNP